MFVGVVEHMVDIEIEVVEWEVVDNRQQQSEVALPGLLLRVRMHQHDVVEEGKISDPCN